MAINKEGTAYTFIFAIVMVAVVGSGLAFVYESLKDRQEENNRVKKMMDILGALNIETNRKEAQADYDQYILSDESLVLNSDGSIREIDPETGEEVEAFDVNVRKDFKDKTLAVEDRAYPLYVANVDGGKKYVIPMVGSGLWGPIWGYIAVEEDQQTIYGAKFDHKGETPGLGAEIKQEFFYSQFVDETISSGGSYSPIKVVKDGSGAGAGNSKVDGITGGTITSKGVEEMVNRTLQVYVKYFNSTES